MDRAFVLSTTVSKCCHIAIDPVFKIGDLRSGIPGSASNLNFSAHFVVGQPLFSDRVPRIIWVPPSSRRPDRRCGQVCFTAAPQCRPNHSASSADTWMSSPHWNVRASPEHSTMARRLRSCVLRPNAAKDAARPRPRRHTRQAGTQGAVRRASQAGGTPQTRRGITA